jgi:hypothetical protein
LPETWLSAEGAKSAMTFRAFSASKNLEGLYLGRCPRLLHYAPLALLKSDTIENNERLSRGVVFWLRLRRMTAARIGYTRVRYVGA